MIKYGKTMANFAMASTLLILTSPAYAVDGTINFKAKIISAACTVSSVANSTTTSGAIDFGTVNAANFGTVGSKTAAVPFTITLMDCATQVPNISFTGTPVTKSNYTYLFESGISGIGIQLQDGGTNGGNYISGVSADNTGFHSFQSINGVPGSNGNTLQVTATTGKFNAYLVDYKGSTQYSGTIDTDITFVLDYGTI